MKSFGKNIEEIYCNICGKYCAMPLTTDDMDNEGLLKVKVVGGYPSTLGNGDGALDDMD
jgi:hypothetical protein